MHETLAAGRQPEENPVSTARNRVSVCAMNINTQTDRVAKIADVLFGPQPPTVANEKGHPSRSGESGLLHDDLDNLADCIEYLSLQIERLTPLGVDSRADATGPALAQASLRGNQNTRY